MEDFAKAAGSNVSVAIMTTACYSGGWVVNPHFSYTVLSAVRTDKPSEAWRNSESLGRYCGSIWASAVQKVLSDLDSPMLKGNTDPETRKKAPPKDFDRTYAAFAKQIYDSLFLNVDKFACVHDIRCSAQNDAWEQCWSRRIGIPLANFKPKLDALKDWPNLNLDVRRRSSIGREYTLEQRRKILSGEKGMKLSEQIRGSFGGSDKTLRRFLVYQARDYLYCIPGKDTHGPNTSAHTQLRRLASGNAETNDEDLKRCWEDTEIPGEKDGNGGQATGTYPDTRTQTTKWQPASMCKI